MIATFFPRLALNQEVDQQALILLSTEKPKNDLEVQVIERTIEFFLNSMPTSRRFISEKVKAKVREVWNLAKIRLIERYNGLTTRNWVVQNESESLPEIAKISLVKSPSNGHKAAREKIIAIRKLPDFPELF